MKRIIILLLLILTTVPSVVKAQADWDPKANDDAVVESGRARFTVLTPEMIRIQYSARKKFEDRASFAVVNRKLDVPDYTAEEIDGYLYIKTSKLTLRYKVGGVISANFNPNVLQITFNMNGEEKLWYPGKDDALNLKGTSRTLDGDIGDTHRVNLENGLLSRDGWAVVDESYSATRGDGSKSYVFDGDVDGMKWWAKPVDTAAIDWYFLGYGHEYKKALGDYVKIAGREPMPPLYMFGYWYSKYQAYTANQFQSLVREMENNDIPHDVMIFDMDWHKSGWTGWTWNNSLIPNPKSLITWMHNHNMKVALNLHPADGVDSDEDGYSTIAADMGVSGDGTVQWQLEDSTFYKSLFKNIIRVRESEGVDFWWIDWQQKLLVGDHANERGYTCETGAEYLGETFWCNHVFYNDMQLKRTDRRPVIFHRWGGMGSHRYPIGFSGDTYATYGTLAFEPYYTATAANVCFGYWGHDLGAHLLIGDSEHVDPEMYLRWLQYGVFSPLLRTHGASQANCERRIWKFDNFDLMNDALKLRYTLVPYIYNAAREAYDTGVSICRPLYYEWPEDNRSYSDETEYLFGDDMLVAPITEAVSGNGTASRKIWLPEGKWYDVCGNRLLEGDMEFTGNYTTADIPYFIRQGSIIPCNPKVDNLKSQVPQLVLKVIPGADGEGRFYEDDGDSENYKNGAYSTTSFSQVRMDVAVYLTVNPRVGTFPGQLDARSYCVEFLLAEKPEQVLVDGNAVDYVYDETQKMLTVNVPETSVDKAVNIVVIYDVEGIENTEIVANSEKKYNIQGMRVNDSAKGVIITKDRKFIKK